MENSIMYRLGIDPGYLILGLAVITLILFITVIICLVKMGQLYRRYDLFMRGKDAETLEDLLIKQIEDINLLKIEDKTNKENIRAINRNIRASFQKLGLVRYNAFQGMGGNLSFAIALLDYTNSGFVLNSVHSREGCYMYLKRVDRGQTEVLLGSEEREALEQALGYVEYSEPADK
ncbi:MAG TPA: DUF4446 family protein [Candidatus Cottocaccamicrobium excrementipullorum]|nr:DUF4446 family protein [Candidatus Cottocaccamicrobium excrementipullorum]